MGEITVFSTNGAGTMEFQYANKVGPLLSSHIEINSNGSQT
jgi:hypothetical protein